MHGLRTNDDAVAGVIFGVLLGFLAAGWAEARHWRLASAHGPPDARAAVIGALVGAVGGRWLGDRLSGGRDAAASQHSTKPTNERVTISAVKACAGARLRPVWMRSRVAQPTR